MMTRSRYNLPNQTIVTRRYFTTHGAIAVLAALTASLWISVAHADTEFNLDDHAGKVVLVDFWASWCVPCRRSFPWMNTMQTKYQDDGLVIVAVNVDNDLEAANRFLTEFPPKFQVHFDADKSLARKYEVVAMPSSFLIGRDGRVVTKHLGFKVLQQEEYEAAIRAALDLEK
jgi:thiol-disulfide isomerase/thioredoxin